MRELGIETTFAAIPTAFSSAAAVRQVTTSEPAASRITSGEVTSGVVYDYLRLELDENHQTASTSAPSNL